MSPSSARARCGAEDSLTDGAGAPSCSSSTCRARRSCIAARGVWWDGAGQERGVEDGWGLYRAVGGGNLGQRGLVAVPGAGDASAVHLGEEPGGGGAAPRLFRAVGGLVAERVGGVEVRAELDECLAHLEVAHERRDVQRRVAPPGGLVDLGTQLDELGHHSGVVVEAREVKGVRFEVLVDEWAQRVDVCPGTNERCNFINVALLYGPEQFGLGVFSHLSAPATQIDVRLEG